eukprot:3992574-Alexandrium_andersonii.AAC.1
MGLGVSAPCRHLWPVDPSGTGLPGAGRWRSLPCAFGTGRRPSARAGPRRWIVAGAWGALARPAAA